MICKKEKAFIGTVVHVINLFRKTAACGATFSCVGASCVCALFRVDSSNVSVCRVKHVDNHYRSCLELMLGNPGKEQCGFGINFMFNSIHLNCVLRCTLVNLGLCFNEFRQSLFHRGRFLISQSQTCSVMTVSFFVCLSLYMIHVPLNMKRS